MLNHSKKIFLAGASLLLCHCMAFSQLKFEREFNTEPAYSYIYEWTEIDGKAYFSAYDGSFGYELWQFDPATEQATRLTDLREKNGDSYPYDMVAYGGKVFFMAHNDEGNAQLYFFNPQTAQVQLATSFYFDDKYDGGNLAVYNNKLWLTAYFDGRFNLWSYDASTGEATEILAPATGHQTFFSPGAKIEHNGRLYFHARRTDQEIVLWSYDDMTGSFKEEPGAAGIDANWFISCSGTLFMANDNNWYSYDEVNDTAQVLSNTGYYTRGAECFQGKFWYLGSVSDGVAVFDPTTGQSNYLKDLVPGFPDDAISLKVVDEKLFFRAHHLPAANKAVWQYDPSNNSVEYLPTFDSVDTEIISLMKNGDDFYAVGKINLQAEVYKFSPATNSYGIVADINKSTHGGFTSATIFHPYEDAFYFTAIPSTQHEIWYKDLQTGQYANLTDQLVDEGMPVINNTSAQLGGRFYFSGEFSTSAGWRQLLSYKTGEDSLRWHLTIPPSPPNTSFQLLHGLRAYKGNLIFSANKDSNLGKRLFIFDTLSQTALVVPGTEQLFAIPYFIQGDKLFFSGHVQPNPSSSKNYYEVDLQTGNLLEIANYSSIFSSSQPMYDLGDKIVYPAHEPNGPSFLQIYHPSTGTKTNVPPPPGLTHTFIDREAWVQGKLWFTDNYSDTIFYLDPVTETCGIGLNLKPLGIKVASGMVEFDNKLYFAGQTYATGSELYEYDFATGQVRLYADINPGGGDSGPQNFTVIGNRLYFTADDGRRGRELWSLSNCFFVSTTVVPDSLGQNTGQINLDIQGGTPPFSILWSNGATSQNLMDLAAGYYETTITDATGCEATVNTVLSGGLASSTREAKLLQVNVFPNPVTDLLQIELIEWREGLSAALYNFSGAKMSEQRIGGLKECIDVSGLPAGMYFLAVRADDGHSSVWKIVHF